MSAQRQYPAINADNLRAVLAQIEAHPETFDQSQWPCSTSHCFFGWAQIMSGNKVSVRTVRIDARKWLGLTAYEADKLSNVLNTLDALRTYVKEFTSDGYNRAGFDCDGYNRDGYTRAGYTRAGYTRDGYTRAGYNRAGFDCDGYNRDGYTRDGYNRAGYNRDGYNRAGFDCDGYHRDGFDCDGLNPENLTREEVRAIGGTS